MKSITTIAWAGLVGLFTVPFLIPSHSLPITSFYTEWWAILCGLLLLVPWLFPSGIRRLYLPFLAWILVALGGLILLQMGLGRLVYLAQGGLALFYLFWALLLMPAVYALADAQGRDKVMIVLAWALLTGGGLNAIIGIFQAFDIHSLVTDLLFSYAPANTAYGNLAQPNHYADYLATAFSALLYLSNRNRLPWPILFILGLVLLVGLALSASRSVWLYFIAMLILAIIFQAKQPAPDARRLLVALILAMICFQMLQVAFTSIGLTTANDRLQNLIQSLTPRLALWQDALYMFVSSPGLGVGFKNYAWYHFELVRSGQSLFAGVSAYEPISWNHAHNIALHLMAEFGFVAILLIIGAGWWLFRVMRRVVTIEQWWLASALSIITIHSLLEFPLWYANFLGTFAVFVTLAEDRPMELNVPEKNLRRLTVFIAMVSFSLLALFYSTYSSLEKAIILLRTPFKTEEINRQFQQAFKTAQINPFFAPQTDELFSQLPIAGPGLQALINLQLKLNEKVIHLRADANHIYHRVTLLWLSGRSQEAENWLTESIKAYPNSLPSYSDRIEKMYEKNPELVPLLQMVRRHQAAVIAD